jgi:hypothetical protein
MPIDICSSINNISHYVFGSTVLNGLLSSSIIMAIIITIIMIILVMIMYPAKKGTSFTILVKMAIYMLLSTIFIVFLHDSVLKCLYQDHVKETDDESILGGTTTNTRNPVYGNWKSVSPNDPIVSPNDPIVSPNDPIVSPNTNDINKPIYTNDTNSNSDNIPIVNNTMNPNDPNKYSGSIITGNGFGKLGGYHPPPTAGNPYR